MEITDYSKEYKEKPSVGKHSALFPKNIFCDITSATGCTGRHNNVNVFFYLVQSLHAIVKHCIWQNANMFILFQQDQRTLKYFYKTHCHRDMDFDDFKNFCYKAWDKPYRFVVINLWVWYGRYWAYYTDAYTLRSYLDK